MQRTSVIPVPSCLVVCLLLSVTAAVSHSQTAPPDRILETIDQGQMTALPGNVHPWARAQFDQGRVDPGMEMQGVTISFKLSAAQQAALDQLIAEQQDVSSPNYHQWLTPEEYAARFGMSQNDLNRVTSWLGSQGFSRIQVSRSATRVAFDGTAAQVEAAFRTEIHSYLVDGETHFANALEPSVPAALASTVLGFRRLDNFRPRPRVRPTAHFTSSVSGIHFMTPGDFATIYDLTPLYNLGLDGTGITIAVMGQTVIPLADAAAFRSAAGLPAKAPTLLLTPNTGTAATSTGDLNEANLDVEWSGGVAKGATVLYVYAGSTGSVFDALTYAIDHNLAPVIGISYGNCEANIGTPPLTVAQNLRTLVQQGVSQGQTLSAASGDDGAADCEPSASDPNNTSATSGLAIDVPGAIPEVTSVGGSEFMGDPTSLTATQYWGATPGTDDISSALSYIPEMAWNDTAADGQLSAGGGGVSTFFTKPTWQTALTPADGKRDVPDIALNASNAHDPYLVCSQGSCVVGFRESAGGNLNPFGGTSVSAQVFAGILAILNQATNSKGLGNANMELYALAASSPAAFHDITTGNNLVPCTSGTVDCPAGTTEIGFMAKAGYDLATGLGSLDVASLAKAWPGFVGAGTTTVTTSSNLTAALGTNVTFTATVTPALANGPAASGTVQFVIDGTDAGSAAAIANGTATYATRTLSLGPHSVLAIYSGDANYSTSTSATITETVVNGFTVSGAAVAISAPGVSGSSTITVVPGTGFTGMVSLTCAPPAGVEIACSFGSTTPVTISGTSSGTATMTVTTTAPHALARSNPRADARPRDRMGWWMGSGGAFFAGFFMIGLPSRRRRSTAILGLLFSVCLAVGVGCGGGSGSSGGGGGAQTDPGTPANSYTVVVTGTSGSITTTANVAVTVQ
jgi:subtilase family serine protease